MSFNIVWLFFKVYFYRLHICNQKCNLNVVHFHLTDVLQSSNFRPPRYLEIRKLKQRMTDKIIQLDDLFHSSAIINRSNTTAK